MRNKQPSSRHRTLALGLAAACIVGTLALRVKDNPKQEEALSIRRPIAATENSPHSALQPSQANFEPNHSKLFAWPRIPGATPSIKYFGQERQLRVDPNRIALIAPENYTATSETPLVEGTTELPHPLPGWLYVDTSELWKIAKEQGDWNPNDFSRSITHAATQLGALYAAPVFLDFRDDPELPQQAVLFGVEPNTSQDRVLALARQHGPVDRIEYLGASNTDVYVSYKVADGYKIIDIANRLLENPEVRYAEPDMFITGRIPASIELETAMPEGASIDFGPGKTVDPAIDDPLWGENQISVPNDPLFVGAGGWGLENTGLSGGQAGFDMDALDAWDLTTGDSSVIAVVIDNGIEPSHPDLNQWTGNGKDFTPDPVTDGRPYTSNDNHGTAVAGCISGKMNNGVGASGIAPGVKVASARPHYNGQPNGSFSTSYSWVVDAINWAQTIGAKVTVNSNSYGSASSSVTSAYANTRAAGITHFAAAGNSGAGSISYPSSAAAVNSVGASQRDGTKSSFSQYATGLAYLAPGTSVTTTDRTGTAGYNTSDYATVNGTSFAAPYACGVAALLYSYRPTITPDEVESAMTSTCIDMGAAGYDTTNGYGHVNARAALGSLGITVTAKSANGKVLLEWSNPADSGMTTSDIYIRYSTSGYPASSSDGTEIYSGSASQFEHTSLSPGTTYYYSFWGNNGSAYASFGMNAQASVQAIGNTIPLFLENPTSGYVAKWLIDSSGTRAVGGLAHPSPMSSGWKVKTTADMNGDGIKDLVLENSATRYVSKWLLNEYGERVSGGLIHDSPMGAGWEVVGAADLNGDGVEDLLLENRTQRLVSKWLLNSSGVRVSGGLVYDDPMGPGWSVAGTADLNGDGIDDVLLQNEGTGYVSKWLINSSGVRESGGLVHSSPMSSGWSIAGTADLNGDGIEDVLLQNIGTGYVSKWLINSSGVRASGGLVHSSPMSSGWQVSAIGDLDSDGIDDIVLHNPSTQLVSKWIINASGVRESGGLISDSPMSSDWRIAVYAGN